MLSTPALVRVSDMNSSPSCRRIARQYVIISSDLGPGEDSPGGSGQRRRTIPPMSDRAASVERDERTDWVRHVIEQLHHEYAPLVDGEPADYIPELTRADPDRYGVSVATVDGSRWGRRLDRAFTIQSISKPLVYGLALETHGRDEVMRRVGVAPTGDGFNAIVLDEITTGPRIPWSTPVRSP